VTAAASVGDTGRRVLAKQVFPSDLGALSDIRDFVEKWGQEVGLGEEQRYRMKLAVSEASANAMEHPEEKSDLTLWAWDRGDRFTVDLWHAGQFRVKTGEDRGHRGMGLPLMLASVDETAFACLPEGGTRVSLSMFLKVGPPPGHHES
jgi:anti-sigma regulatory factor (Ser/Thr protein kinase)